MGASTLLVQRGVKTMDIQTITQWAGVLVALAPALLLVGFIWIILRTDSLHVVTRRLWLLVHGSHEVADPAIRAFVEEQSSLTAFRMFSGIRANSVGDAHQVMDWAKENMVSLRTIAHCGEYFDVERRLVKVHKLPSRLLQRAQITLAFVGLLAAMLCLGAVASPKVVFIFKAERQWFLADQSSAQALWPPTAWLVDPLRKTECGKPLPATAEQTAFRRDHEAVLCEMLSDEKWPAHLVSALWAQRSALLWIAAAMLWFMFWCATCWRRVVEARELALRRIDPSLPGSQLSLSF